VPTPTGRYCQQKKLTPKISEERIAGDVWVWVATDADTKLIPSWLLGKRDAGCATEFIQDLATRLSNRIQLSTDSLKVHMNGVYDAFGGDIMAFCTRSTVRSLPMMPATAPQSASAAT